MAEPVRYSRTPFLIVHRENKVRKDVYGAIDDAIVLQAQHIRGPDPSDTVLIVMHPIGAPAWLPVFAQLARAGHHIIACASRYWTGDAPLEMENVLLDLGACIKDAKERLGYKKTVLLGWSGGGSLMAGYQAEAEKPVIQLSASGEETPLAGAPLIAGDAIMLVASHRSRHKLLTGQLDPSVFDEMDPDRRDPALDLYDPANPAQPPYQADFLATYRQAQIDRNRRISAWAKDKLAGLKAKGRCAWRVLLRRPPDDGRSALDRSDGRSQPAPAQLDLSRRSARCERQRGGARPVQFAARLAVAVEL